MKLILFDIDSTLLQDGGASGRAYEHAFRELFGMLPAVVGKHGKTDPDISREIALATFGRELTFEEERLLHGRYVELFPGYAEECGAFAVLPGAVVLCETLHNDPLYALGIQTGNLEPCAIAKLRKARLDPYFRFGGYGSDASDRVALVRKAIERGNAVTGQDCNGSDIIVIGDSPFDILAGKSNGVLAIGVTTGKDTAAELIAAGADAVVPDLSKASGIMEILDGWKR